MLPEPSPEAYRRLLRLRTVRRYRPEAIPDAALEQILEAGRWTGSSKNTQPWAFVVVREEAGRKGLAECGRFTAPLEEAVAVVVVVRLPGGGDFDMGRAAQNMMLAAADLGIGSCPVTLHHEARARRLLGVPDDHGCRWALALGYPHPELEAEHRRARTGWLPAGRRPLPDFVHYERY